VRTTKAATRTAVRRVMVLITIENTGEREPR
jgi:hypothetical protein